MSEMRTVHDPFLGKDVQISNRLVDRLRGKYASGPHLPNGNPEFGWKQFQAPPIQHEAAARIETLESELSDAKADLLRIHNEKMAFFEELIASRAEGEELKKALGSVIDFCDAATHGDGEYNDARERLIRIWRGEKA